MTSLIFNQLSKCVKTAIHTLYRKLAILVNLYYHLEVLRFFLNQNMFNEPNVHFFFKVGKGHQFKVWQSLPNQNESECVNDDDKSILTFQCCSQPNMTSILNGETFRHHMRSPRCWKVINYGSNKPKQTNTCSVECH